MRLLLPTTVARLQRSVFPVWSPRVPHRAFVTRSWMWPLLSTPWQSSGAWDHHSMRRLNLPSLTLKRIISFLAKLSKICVPRRSNHFKHWRIWSLSCQESFWSPRVSSNRRAHQHNPDTKNSSRESQNSTNESESNSIHRERRSL